jgi:hypothetical protein
MLRIISGQRLAELESQAAEAMTSAERLVPLDHEALVVERDQLAEEVKTLQDERDRATKARATVTAERDRLREELKTAEPQLQAQLHAALELNAKQDARLVDLTKCNDVLSRELRDLRQPAPEEVTV